MNVYAAENFELPAAVEIVLAVLGVIGFILTVVGLQLTIRWTPRRQNEEPKRGRPLHSIRFWRPSQYSLALGYLQEFCARLREKAYHPGTERGRVTESDLVRWITQLGLTCAAQMVPQSLGKANLFRVSKVVTDEGRATEVRVYSSDFVGVFSPGQLASPLNPTFLRDLRLAEHRQRDADTPAALECIAEGMPIVQSLRRRAATFDEPERVLGATHVLAIPLVKGFHAVSHVDQIVSITVDLKLRKLTGWIFDHRDYQKMSIFRRASRLSRLLSDIPQLSDPRFRPIGDWTRLPESTGPPNAPSDRQQSASHRRAADKV